MSLADPTPSSENYPTLWGQDLFSAGSTPCRRAEFREHRRRHGSLSCSVTVTWPRLGGADRLPQLVSCTAAQAWIAVRRAPGCRERTRRGDRLGPRGATR